MIIVNVFAITLMGLYLVFYYFMTEKKVIYLSELLHILTSL